MSAVPGPRRGRSRTAGAFARPYPIEPIETSTDRRVPLANVMDLLLDAVCVVDTQGRFAFVSAAFERIFGYSPQEIVGKPMIDLVFHEDRARTLLAVEEIVAGTHEPHFENRYVRKDGRIVHIMWSARWSPADQVRVAVARDVTERKRAESMQAALYAISEAAYASEDLLALFQRIHGIVGRLLPARNFFVALYDRDRDQLSFPYHVDDGQEAPATGALDSGTSSAQVVGTGRTLHLQRDGTAALPESARPDVGPGALDWLGVPLRTQDGVIGALVVKNRSPDVRYTPCDIELLQFVSTQVAAAIERKRMDARLKYVALHDPLTDLPNRELFQDRLRTAMVRARRDELHLALLYIDLDGFKQVNDTHGHGVGDLLLTQLARRLERCVRESDTVSRIGGDEFLVLLHDIRSPDQALRVAEKIRVAVGEPVETAGQRLRVSPSIGISLYDEHGTDWTQLIAQADEAMYRAKKDGGDRFRMAVVPDSQARQ